MADRPSVAAVIVTYNRLDKLRTTLQTVWEQTHACEWIIVVDNASTDGTREYLQGLSEPGDSEPRLVVIRNEENLGGAGGFEHGMAVGARLGADFVWVMDDDCYPEPDALEVLVDQQRIASVTQDREIPFACSVVRFSDGSLSRMNNAKSSWDWARLVLEGLSAVLVKECTFVSVLVPRWALEQSGLPLGEYFIWYDDKEFTRRLSKAHGPGIAAFTSRAVHDMPSNSGVDYRQVTAENVWKFEKGARNRAATTLRMEGRIAYLTFCLEVVRKLRAGKVPMSVRRRMLRALVQARTFAPKPRFPSDPRYDRHDIVVRSAAHSAKQSAAATAVREPSPRQS